MMPFSGWSPLSGAFRAEADGVSLYLPEPRTSLDDMTVFMSVGRELERLGIHEDHVEIERLEADNNYIRLRFRTTSEATTFRLATKHPFQTSVEP